jgi:hypothetical protein
LIISVSFRSPSDTLTSLRYQVLKRLHDNFNIYACSVTLYDRQDWELGMSESDTIQLAIPADETDVINIILFPNEFFEFQFRSKQLILKKILFLPMNNYVK